MKTTIRMDSLLAIAACGLWLGGAANASAQENVAPVTSTQTISEAAAAVIPETGTLTNAPMETPVATRGINHEAIVVAGRDFELKAEDSADDVVVLGGSAKIHGKVRDAVVVIGGDAFIDGEVGDCVTTVGGSIHLDGKVRREVVAVLGDVTLGPEAHVGREVVTVGGQLTADKDAYVGGKVQQIGLPKFEEFRHWFVQCVLKMRPLAPQVGWVWYVWAVFTVIYLITALLFRRPVQASVNQLTARPASTFLFGLLANLVLPVIMAILAATGIGVLVVPFFLAAQVLGMVVGKVAILEYLGIRIGQYSGAQFLQKPIAAFLLGTIIITLLYLVPVVGIIIWGVTSVWGLGGAVTAVFAGSQREATKPPAALTPPPDGTAASTPANVPAAAVANIGAMGFAAGGAGEGTSSVAVGSPASPAEAPATPGTMLAVRTDAPPLAHPKAGFWLRMGAAGLDFILMCIAATVLGPLVLIAALFYFAGMWAWKGTTVGGIVLKLQVVRSDGGPLTFMVALVRALAATFSAVALFLGFFWIGWDPDKQAWHDKIAGTDVVRLPYSVPLVML